MRVDAAVIVRLDTVEGGPCVQCNGIGRTDAALGRVCSSCEGVGVYPDQIHVEYGPGEDPNLRHHVWVVRDDEVYLY